MVTCNVTIHICLLAGRPHYTQASHHVSGREGEPLHRWHHSDYFICYYHLYWHHADQFICYYHLNWHHTDHVICYYHLYTLSLASPSITPTSLLMISQGDNPSLQVHCARQLLYRGIDKTIRNKAGQTAYEVAALTSNFVIMDDITNFKPEQAGMVFIRLDD